MSTPKRNTRSAAGLSNMSKRMLMHATRMPVKMCMHVIGDEKITYEELIVRVGAVIEQYRKLGIKAGDRVLITMALCVDLYVSLLASFSIGAVVVVLDTSMGMSRVNHCIGTVEPKVWIRKSGSMWYLRYLLSAVRAIPLQVLVSKGMYGGSQHRWKMADVLETEVALCTFTTGSTGLPKPVMRTHDFLMVQSKAISQAVETFSPLPETETIGLTNLVIFAIHFLHVGSGVVVQPGLKQWSPARVCDVMREDRVTVTMGSPAFLEGLCQHCLDTDTLVPCEITVAGGAPVFHHTFDVMCRATPRRNAIVVYGSTESEPISYVVATEKEAAEREGGGMRAKGLCVGKPFIENGVRIIRILDDERLSDQPLAGLEVGVGEIGEILTCGWQVNVKNIQPKDRFIDSSPDGQWYLRTGDAGFLDAEGRVWLVGRCKWRVQRDGGSETFFSTVEEQRLLDTFYPEVTFAAYLPNDGASYLFIEAPRGLSAASRARLDRLLQSRKMPVDHLRIMRHIPRDRRHASKADTGTLFAPRRLLSPLRLALLLLLLLLAVALLGMLHATGTVDARQLPSRAGALAASLKDAVARKQE